LFSSKFNYLSKKRGASLTKFRIYHTPPFLLSMQKQSISIGSLLCTKISVTIILMKFTWLHTYTLWYNHKKTNYPVGIGMFCYISTVPLFSTPNFTNISIKKWENRGMTMWLRTLLECTHFEGCLVTFLCSLFQPCQFWCRLINIYHTPPFLLSMQKQSISIGSLLCTKISVTIKHHIIIFCKC
jgi:hypothetical protein